MCFCGVYCLEIAEFALTTRQTVVENACVCVYITFPLSDVCVHRVVDVVCARAFVPQCVKAEAATLASFIM